MDYAWGSPAAVHASSMALVWLSCDGPKGEEGVVLEGELWGGGDRKMDGHLHVVLKSHLSYCLSCKMIGSLCNAKK